MPLYHDCSISGKYVLLTRTPYLLTPRKILGSLLGFSGMFEWNDADGAHVDVYCKATLELLASVATPAFSCYHHVNAYEDEQVLLRVFLNARPVSKSWHGPDIAFVLAIYSNLYCRASHCEYGKDIAKQNFAGISSDR
jgi:carotenoid cleavage dioxygenase-like enzyme